jgi:hypothetical protein
MCLCLSVQHALPSMLTVGHCRQVVYLLLIRQGEHVQQSVVCKCSACLSRLVVGQCTPGSCRLARYRAAFHAIVAVPV